MLLSMWCIPRVCAETAEDSNTPHTNPTLDLRVTLETDYRSEDSPDLSQVSDDANHYFVTAPFRDRRAVAHVPRSFVAVGIEEIHYRPSFIKVFKFRLIPRKVSRLMMPWGFPSESTTGKVSNGRFSKFSPFI